MTDFFDRVERELTGAITREQPTAARRRGRVAAWMASHTLLAIAGGIVIGGAGAAAAVVSLTGTPSHPATGLIPRGPTEHRIRDLRYEVTMAPSLNVAEPGWCSGVSFAYSGARRGFGGFGCGPAAKSPVHVLGGGTTTVGRPGAPRLFAYSIVDRRVAYAITTSGDRIEPVDDAGLPNGWRVIVQLPGESHTGNLRFRDAQDRAIPTEIRGYDVVTSFAANQTAVGALGPVPAEAPCAVTLPTAYDVRYSRWIRKPRPTDGLNGRAFLTCAQTAARIDDEWVEVSVLVDAADPGRATPAELPGTTRSPTTRRAVELGVIEPSYFAGLRPQPGDLPDRGPSAAGARASAWREGHTWVVVRARTRAVRERTLEQAAVRAPR